MYRLGSDIRYLQGLAPYIYLSYLISRNYLGVTVVYSSQICRAYSVLPPLFTSSPAWIPLLSLLTTFKTHLSGTILARGMIFAIIIIQGCGGGFLQKLLLFPIPNNSGTILAKAMHRFLHSVILQYSII